MTFSRGRSLRIKSKSLKSRSSLSKSALNLQMFDTNHLIGFVPSSADASAGQGTKLDVDSRVTKCLKKLKLLSSSSGPIMPRGKVRQMLKSISSRRMKRMESKVPILSSKESIISTSNSSIVIWEEIYETLRRQSWWLSLKTSRLSKHWKLKYCIFVNKVENHINVSFWGNIKSCTRWESHLCTILFFLLFSVLPSI